MLRSAAPVRTEHAEAVRIIHHDACAVLLGKADDLRQVADVTAHAEHAIGHNQPACGFGDVLQLFFKVRHVVMAVAEHGGIAELAAIINACVVFPVTENIVILARDGADDAKVALKACRKRHNGFLTDEIRQFFLKLHVQRQRAVEKTRAGAAGAIPLKRFEASFDYTRVRGKAEIVIGAEHNAALALHDDLYILTRFELVKVRIDVRRPDLINIGIGTFCE